MHDSIPTAHAELSDQEKTALSVRTDLRAGAIMNGCHMHQDGHIVSMCCPTAEGEKCVSSFPGVGGF